MRSNSFDAIVVGAGVSGLAAAAELSGAGLRVLVLEARNRTGGRIFTDRSKRGEHPIELGAEFIHGGNRALSAVMSEAGLKQHHVPEKHWLIESGRRRSLPDAYDRIDGVMQHIGPATRGSFASWLKREGAALPALNRRLAASFVEGFQATAREKMSAHTSYVAGMVGEGAQGRLVGGYDRLVDALCGKLTQHRVELRLNSPVKAVHWQPHEVVVASGGRRWRGRVALITVPLGVLKAPVRAKGAIAFVPPLVEKKKLWAKLEMGHVSRVTLRMRSTFWNSSVLPTELRGSRGANFGFLHSVGREFPVWWTEAPRPILVGWTGGPGAVALGKLSEKQLVERAIQNLARLLGAEANALSALVIEGRSHRWEADPYTRGAYSFSMAGQESAPSQLAEPVDSTLFFAGEATADPLELGTVHGALASGQRAAREILNALPEA